MQEALREAIVKVSQNLLELLFCLVEEPITAQSPAIIPNLELLEAQRIAIRQEPVFSGKVY